MNYTGFVNNMIKNVDRVVDFAEKGAQIYHENDKLLLLFLICVP